MVITVQRAVTLLLLLLTLALSTASSKMAGAHWLLFLLVGLWAGWQQRQQPAGLNDASLAARAWLLLCMGAFAFRAVAVMYWGEGWEERHAELRLMLGALGVYGILRTTASDSWLTGAILTRWASHALTLSCLSGLYIVVTDGRGAVTTHPIAWAGGVAMFSLWLAHAAVGIRGLAWERIFWTMGAFAGMLAVLASESRGAYGVVLWIGLVWVGWVGRHGNWKKIFVGLLIVLLASGLLTQTRLMETPKQRVAQALQEISASRNNMSGAQNSSVGARLVLWQLAKQAVPQSPWVGYGQKQRLDLIKDWGRQQHSETVTSLGHMHNQYMQDMMDHGLWGLASTLMYLVGLTSLALWLLKRRHVFAGLTLGGVAFMHATTSLTNVNFAHNYYPTVMAVVVGLALMSIQTSSPRQIEG
jgi:O-antigen ligase